MRPGDRNHGGSFAIDPGALLHGWAAAAISVGVGAVLLTTAGILLDWEPSRMLLRSLSLVSMFLAGVFAGRRCRCRAWLNGMFTTVGLLAILGWLTEGFSQAGWLFRLRTLLFMSFLGMLGGIIGGLKRKDR